jgi:hypothetical protein
VSVNYTYIFPGMYIVRTQAGYRHAFRHWYGQDNKTNNSAMRNARGYPTSYPCLVSFTWDSRGYNDAICNSVSLTFLQGAIIDSEETYQKSKGNMLEKSKEELQDDVDRLTKENQHLHYKLAGASLRADNGWSRYEQANKARAREEQLVSSVKSGIEKIVNMLYENVVADPTAVHPLFLQATAEIKELFNT